MADGDDVPHIDIDFSDFPDKEIENIAHEESARSVWPAAPHP
jgi:hypothetical protein